MVWKFNLEKEKSWIYIYASVSNCLRLLMVDSSRYLIYYIELAWIFFMALHKHTDTHVLNEKRNKEENRKCERNTSEASLFQIARVFLSIPKVWETMVLLITEKNNRHSLSNGHFVIRTFFFSLSLSAEWCKKKIQKLFFFSVHKKSKKKTSVYY